MPYTLADLISYIEPLVETEIFVPCATATDAAEGKVLYAHGLATVIALAVKKYNDEIIRNAEITPTGSVSITTRVDAEIL
jgi:hypothetical protein